MSMFSGEVAFDELCVDGGVVMCVIKIVAVFFVNDTATTEIYTLPLHDALPISLGSSWMFTANVLLILLWLIAGPFFKYSDTWQLVVNTATTVITYLAVFLIQNTQNRDAQAIHLKLDELIRGVSGAHTHLVDLENLTDEELAELQKEFTRLRAKHEKARVIEHAPASAE